MEGGRMAMCSTHVTKQRRLLVAALKPTEPLLSLMGVLQQPQHAYKQQ